MMAPPTPAPMCVTFVDQARFVQALVAEAAAIPKRARSRRRSRPTSSKCRRQPAARPLVAPAPDFQVTFFHGRRRDREDMLARDARDEARYRDKKGSVRPRAAADCPCALTAALLREPLAEFRTHFPKAKTREELEALAAKAQAGLHERRPESLPVTAQEKRMLRRWGYHPVQQRSDRCVAAVGADGAPLPPPLPPPWTKTWASTGSKWANAAAVIAAARDQANMRGEWVAGAHAIAYRDECKAGARWINNYAKRGHLDALGPASSAQAKLLTHITEEEWEAARRERQQHRLYRDAVLRRGAFAEEHALGGNDSEALSDGRHAAGLSAAAFAASVAAAAEQAAACAELQVQARAPLAAVPAAAASVHGDHGSSAGCGGASVASTLRLSSTSSVSVCEWGPLGR
eukprot:TRINITY_DN10973_c0_g1_i1.p1 TRINITY_DN10973_c0_g1~~TRINITY_DN10973_c0_g1_i1.p1  ORF type:complete len:403 (-),score=94.70 TRINITY_DN10973_c0_g1_i1:129-1337(-)